MLKAKLATERDLYLYENKYQWRTQQLHNMNSSLTMLLKGKILIICMWYSKIIRVLPICINMY